MNRRVHLERIRRRTRSELIGLDGDPRFASSEGRARHRVAVDAALEVWIGERTEAEVLEAFESVHAAAASVYDMADIAADETCGRGEPSSTSTAHPCRAHRPTERDARRDPLGRSCARRHGNAIRDELTVD